VELYYLTITILLLGHITTIYAVAWSVCMSVGLRLSVGHMTRKMAEPIKMPFGRMTWVGPSNHVLDGSPDPQRERTVFGVVRPTE